MQSEVASLCDNVGRVLLGKKNVIRLAVATLLARGHLLIEDAPGLGKTLLARSVARSISARFRRIQFTPDLLPSDVTGVSVYNPKEQAFEFVEGPVFTEILLADEINRTSPRTQASLLETMAERQVTVDGTPTALPEIFFVVATQNPVEMGGTYPLPEAQLDRFLMRVRLGYPDAEDELRILALHGAGGHEKNVDAVLSPGDIRRMQREVQEVTVSEAMQRYIISIAAATRVHDHVELGASPRATLAVQAAARSLAYMDGDPYVTPDAVKLVAPAVLAHRLIIDPQRAFAGTTGESVVEEILAEIPIPVPTHDERAAPFQG